METVVDALWKVMGIVLFTMSLEDYGVEKFSTPSAERIGIVRSSCCRRLLSSSVEKSCKRTVSDSFLLPPRQIRLVKAKFALYCSRNWIIHKSESAPEYFGISNAENPVFDRRAMETDRPSQEGCEDVPRELSFLVSAPEADPMPVVTRSSEGTRPEPTSAMHH